mmetsp:Transcript_10637/g.17878  ORF Transcript_10637/g.17878 Transcript_10637/m.17878 type:complete len:88 (+) Transcript_10637:466-729(+)
MRARRNFPTQRSAGTTDELRSLGIPHRHMGIINSPKNMVINSSLNTKQQVSSGKLNSFVIRQAEKLDQNRTILFKQPKQLVRPMHQQ